MSNFFTGTDYVGLEFTTLNDGLTLIRDNLQSAGWSVALDDISANSELKMQGYDVDNNSDSCYFIFRKNTNNNIDVIGYLGDTNDNLEESPPYVLEVDNTSNYENRLWMVADSGSACIMILDGSVGISVKSKEIYKYYLNGLNSIHLGFLKRVSLSDKYAWCIGRIDIAYNHIHFARRFTGNNNPWIRLDKDFNYDENDMYGYYYLKIPVTTFDPLALYTKQGGFIEGDSTNSSDDVKAIHRGTINAVDGLPYFGKFFYLEGRRDSSDNLDFGSEYIIKPLVFRGNVKFCATGMASFLAFEIYTDAFGDAFMSSNNYAAQGIQVG